jgi:hypothetical protein
MSLSKKAKLIMAWCGDEKPWSFAVLLPPPSGDKDPRTMPSGN